MRRCPTTLHAYKLDVTLDPLPPASAGGAKGHSNLRSPLQRATENGDTHSVSCRNRSLFRPAKAGFRRLDQPRRPPAEAVAEAGGYGSSVTSSLQERG